jgi:histidinol-phosphate aminotransferase
MSLSRRAFVQAVGLGGVGLLSSEVIAARGREAFSGLDADAIEAVLQSAPKRDLIKLNANENPYGPGPSALDAARGVLGPTSGRYPGNSAALAGAIASHFSVEPANVLVGTGSGEVIQAAVAAFTSPTRHLVVASPTWEDPGRTAQRLKHPVKAIPVDAALKMDLSGMAAAAKGAGLVFLCNPNNPTGTVHSIANVTKFVEQVLASSPDTTILLDEAYYDFVVDPSYATAVPLAMKYPRVFVTRTFSKVHGMAGLRVGYAIGHPDTLKAIAPHKTGSTNVVSLAAAAASIRDTAHIARQRDQIRTSLEATVRAFADVGCKASDSQGNFILVDVKRPAKEFREACEKMGVAVGRDFPPLTNYARITIGTADEMRVANEVFKKVLSTARATAAAGV